MVTANQLSVCHARIKPYIHNTPVFTSRLVNKELGANLFFKCENFQRAGAYKMRGATNAILQLSKDQKKNGVVTHSSGNFAQALSLAAQSIGVVAHIVMPSTAPEVKKIGVREYGGIIHECTPTVEARQAMANNIANETGATFIHPSNDEHVIIGQGTAAMELLGEQPHLEYLFCPVGGGGLIAGSSLAVKYFGSKCRVLGGEPFEADDAYRSLISGKIEGNTSVNTIADGLKTTLGDINFPIIQNNVEGIIRVDEEEIVMAMQMIWERMKLIIEPSSAVAVAAAISYSKNNYKVFKNKKVGIIISGGNVDLQKLPF
ncbi:pyridoxal-phosphate dependent enzyme [Maribacter confluentis]|uniref:Pyridoxal-phosphate dependent enzyme n=1 Tax=Maribacter confluentis TaxID=1656093 RepID=A0ABT8RNW7_9FLAO|nr:pyridoxal-phosphate dependent enzyme [Maribacter confluentis]MDO1512588.1 pyridoxal-phosphate dependent enzyme [Maribacter confluentis]